MAMLYRFAFVFAAMALLHASASADALDQCPDPEVARKWVKACMQENRYNTKESCEERALAQFCSGE